MKIELSEVYIKWDKRDGHLRITEKKPDGQGFEEITIHESDIEEFACAIAMIRKAGAGRWHTEQRAGQ